MGAIMSLFQIHSYTTRIARRIDGGTNTIQVDLETALKNPDAASALFSFRALPEYRSESARKLRKAVADVIRQDRHSQDANPVTFRSVISPGRTSNANT